jgi:dephospho-CoA kinase
MIIGICGTNGGGKGTVVEYLETKGFRHYSVREFLTAELLRHGREVNRSEMRLLANEIRATKDPAYIIRSLYEQAVAEGAAYAVIESVRNVGEAEFLLSKGIYLLAVDADQERRFHRVQERRSATDQVDFLTFVYHEEREMHPEGPHDMDIRGVMRLAHSTIMNDGSHNELHAHVDALLAALPA